MEFVRLLERNHAVRSIRRLGDKGDRASALLFHNVSYVAVSSVSTAGHATSPETAAARQRGRIVLTHALISPT
jgi:hypothetical protein